MKNTKSILCFCIVVLLLFSLGACMPSSTPTSTATTEVTRTVFSLPTDTPIPCYAMFIPLGYWPDDNHLLGYRIADHQNSSIQTIDISTGESKTILEYTPAPMIQAVWSMLTPGQAILAMQQEDHSIQLFELNEQRVIATLTGHTAPVTAVAFSQADNRVYTGSMDMSVRVWDLDGTLLHTFQPDGADNLPSEVTGLAVSPDGRQLITLPLEGRVKAWDTGDYHRLREYEGLIFGSYNGSSAAFSADGRYLAVSLAAGMGDVSLWRVEDGELLWHGGFMSFAFSPNGELFARTEVGPGATFFEQVVISSSDGQKDLHIFDAVYESAVTNLVFSTEGQHLAWMIMMDGNSEVQVWNVENGKIVLSHRASC